MKCSTAKRKALIAGFGIWLTSALTGVNGAIPTAAQNDPMYDLGYLVVTHYSGVDNTGNTDSTAAIQEAIEDAHDNRLAVFFPSGTYLISDTLKAYKWELWNAGTNTYSVPSSKNHILVGASGANRPIIKLANSANLFDNAGDPRPMISFRMFRAENSQATSKTEPSDPMGNPANFRDLAADIFGSELRNLDFDTNSHSGAFGVYFAAAQNSSIENVKVDAQGSYAGFWGLPGRSMGAANIEVQGGQYGILTRRASGLSHSAGATVVGAKLVNQTVAAVESNDFVPLVMVGFEITKSTGPAITVENISRTADGTMTLIDGQLDVGSGRAIDNPGAKNLYIRNVYVTGTDQLVDSGNSSTVTGTGTWKRIREYVSNDMSGTPPYSNGEDVLQTFSFINGSINRIPEPIVDIEVSAAAPPADLTTRHVWADLPLVDGGTYVDVTDHGATPADINAGKLTGAGGNDDRSSIQAAIDAASTAGHGRVYLPRGVYHIGNTLTLRSNTILFGAGRRISVIAPHNSWQPTSGEATMITTNDDASATTFMGFLEIHTKVGNGGINSNGAQAHDRFNFFDWRAGRNSMITAVELTKEWQDPKIPSNPHSAMRFSGNGGGRFYFLVGMETRIAHPDFRNVDIDGTSEPMWFYGLNVEATKKSDQESDNALTNVELNNASNVRILSMKREGRTGSVTVRDSSNVAVHGSGSMLIPPNFPNNGWMEVLGSSNDVLMSNILIQSFNPEKDFGYGTLIEDLNGSSRQSVVWPNGISVYKRGQLNDVAVYINGAPPSGSSDTQAPSVPQNLTASNPTASSVDLSWSASTDNVGVTDYIIYRDGSEHSVSAGLTYTDTLNVSPSTTYTYTVAARDAAGNVSAQSSSAQVTTLAGSGPATGTVGTTVSLDIYSSTVNAFNFTIENSSTEAAIDSVQWSITGDMAFDYIKSDAAYSRSPSAIDTNNEGSRSSNATLTFSPGILSGATFVSQNGNDIDATVLGGSISGIDVTVTFSDGSQLSGPATLTSTTWTFSGSAAAADTEAPSTPQGLSVSSVTSSSVGLTWSASTDNVGVVDYLIYRDGSQHAVTSTTHTDTQNVSASTTYSYTVAARDAAGNVSTQSSAVQATTARGGGGGTGTVGASVELYIYATSVDSFNFTIDNTSTSAGVQSVRWDIVGGKAFDFFKSDSAYSRSPSDIDVNNDGNLSNNATLTFSPVIGAGNQFTSQNGNDIDATVGGGTINDINVIVTFDDGSQISGPASLSNNRWTFSDSMSLPDTQAPTVPQNLSSTTVTDNSVGLSWTASTDNTGVTEYRIFRDGAQIDTTAGVSYTDNGRSPGTTYSYTVAAADAAGNVSAQSTALPVTTTGSALGDVGATVELDIYQTAVLAFNFTISNTSTDATIDSVLWEIAGDQGFDYFKGDAAYSRVPGEVHENDNVLSSDAYLAFGSGILAGSTFVSQNGNDIDVTVADGTINGINVTVNFDDGSQLSGPATLVGTKWTFDETANAADTEPPSVPTGLSASNITSSSADLSWSASTDNVAVVRYRIYRDGEEIDVSDVASYTSDALDPATNYSYSVAAEDAAGNLSARSDEVPVTTESDSSGTVAASVELNIYSTSVDSFNFTIDNTSTSAAIDNVQWDIIGGKAFDFFKADSAYTSSPAGLDVNNNGTLSNNATLTFGSGIAAGATFTSQNGNDIDATVGGGTITGINVTVVFDDGSQISGAASLSGTKWTFSDSMAPTGDIPPSSPYDVTVGNPGFDSLLVGWEDSRDDNGVLGYRIYRDGVLQHDTQTDTVTNYTDTGLVAGVQYTYRVSAYDIAGNESFSLPAAGSTLDPAINATFELNVYDPVEQLFTFSVLNQSGSIRITEVRFRIEGGDRFDFVQPSTDYRLEGFGITQNDEGNTTLSYSVEFNGSGLSGVNGFVESPAGSDIDPTTPPSSTTGFSIDVFFDDGTNIVRSLSQNGNLWTYSLVDGAQSGTDTEAPSVPQGLTSSDVTDKSVTLNWSPSTDNLYVSEYSVFRDGGYRATVNGTTFQDNDLSASTSYTYTVTALDMVGNESAPSAGHIVTTTAASGGDTQAPSVPQNLAASVVTPNSVSLSWSPSTDNVGVTGYLVYRGTAHVDTVATPSFTDDKLSAGTSYSYSVKAVDAAGNVSASSSAVAVTTETSPSNGGTEPPPVPPNTPGSAVGYTPGEFSVDPSGAANYRIPIIVPPGTAGVQPELALAYSSRAGNGMVGVGWALSGLSAITRCPATIVQDGINDGVDLDTNDRFCLDGRRLMETATAGEYRTEIESFQKVTESGTAGNGPASFTAKDKAGLTRYYGTYAGNDNALIKAAGKSEALVYAVRRIEDAFNNYIEYDYDTTPELSAYRPSAIRYGHSGSVEVARVELEYGDRVDESTGYIAGSTVGTEKRLNKIKTFAGSGAGATQVREYVLQYEYGPVTNNSLLKSVVECETTYSSCLEDTVLTWQTGSRGFTQPEDTGTSYASLANNGMRLLDIDNNGRIDYAYVSGGNWHARMDRPNGAIRSSSFTARGWDNGRAITMDYDGDGYQDILQPNAADTAIEVIRGGPTGLQSVVQTTVDELYLSIRGENTAQADVNGDGLTDLLLATGGVSTQLKVHLNNGSGFDPEIIYFAGVDPNPGPGNTLMNIRSVSNARLRVVNFDSDGRADVLIKSDDCFDTGAPSPFNWACASTYWRVLSFENGQFENKHHFPAGSVSTGAAASHPKVVDTNGDGLSDLLWYRSGQWQVLVSDGTQYLNGWASNSATYEVFVDSSYSQFYSGLAEALDWYSGGTAQASIILTETMLEDAHILDYNSDGKQDVLIKHGANWKALIAEGGGYGTAVLDTGKAAINEDLALVIDVGGDGLPDIMYPRDGQWRIYHARGPQADLLEKVEDGLGAETQVSYATLTDPSVYTGHTPLEDPNQTMQFPVRHLGAPITVVKEFAADNGQGFVNTRYQYAGSKVHVQGRGLLGFSEIKAWNENAEVETVNQHMQLHPFTGMVRVAIQKLKDNNEYANVFQDLALDLEVDFGEICETSPANCDLVLPWLVQGGAVGIPGNKVSETTNEFTTLATTSVSTFPHVIESTELIFPLLKQDGAQPAAYKRTVSDYSQESSSNTSYDVYGNPLRILVTVDNGSGGDAHTVETDNNYQNWTTGNQWCLGRLIDTTVTHGRTDYGSGKPLTGTRNSSFTYNATTCVLETETVEDGTAFELQKTYTHDAFGNRQTETITGADITSRMTTTNYDTSGQFPKTIINALSHSETQNWSTKYGVQTSVVGPNALTTSWNHDGFGRVITETAPLTSVFSNTTFNWCGTGFSCSSTDAVYAVTVTGSDGARNVVEYDRLNREVMTRTRGFDGVDVLQSKHYDPLGREYMVSVPYKQGDSACYTFRKFDALNRVINEWQPGGFAECGTAFAFDAPIPSSGRLSVFEFDTIVGGRAEARATDPEVRTVVRVTNAMDRLLEVYEYDETTKVRTLYDYDAFGNTVWVTDAEDNVTTVDYNVRGFKTAMNDPNMGAWTYEPNVLGEIIEQTDAKSQTVRQSYDLLGRMTQRIDRYDLSSSSRQVTDWIYDTASGKGVGQLHEAIGPYTESAGQASADYKETYQYDSLGRVEHVTRKIATEYFWTTSSYDTQGRLDTLTYPATGGNATASSVGTGRYQVDHVYNGNGFLERVENGSTIHWEATASDAFGNITRFNMGSALRTIRAYDQATGYMTSAMAGTTGNASGILSQNYLWSAAGNLTRRADNVNSVYEEFEYDDLYRLKCIRFNTTNACGGANTYEHTYSLTGNIESKQTQNGDYTNYLYGSNAGPNAVTSVTAAGTPRSYTYDANGNNLAGAGRTIGWTSFNKPSLIQKGPNSSSFDYGPDRGRYRHVAVMPQTAPGSSGDHTVTTLYIGGGFEQITRTSSSTTEFRHYLRAGTGVVAIHTEWSNSNTRTEYLHRDHLGSVAAISDGTGSAASLETFSFDPWGKRRNATTWASHAPGTFLLPTAFDRVSRGYTGHEQLDHIGLIHMNGRVYDPELGRFLSADPNTQLADSTQGFNRYTYVANNPLRYTDPSGYFLKALVSKLVGLIVGTITGQPWLGGLVEGYLSSGGDFKALALGFITQGLGRVSAPFAAALNAYASPLGSGVQAKLAGGKFIDGFKASTIGIISGFAQRSIVSTTELIARDLASAAGGQAAVIAAKEAGVAGGGAKEHPMDESDSAEWDWELSPMDDPPVELTSELRRELRLQDKIVEQIGRASQERRWNVESQNDYSSGNIGTYVYEIDGEFVNETHFPNLNMAEGWIPSPGMFGLTDYTAPPKHKVAAIIIAMRPHTGRQHILGQGPKFLRISRQRSAPVFVVPWRHRAQSPVFRFQDGACQMTDGGDC